jgi:hypothetical protein
VKGYNPEYPPGYLEACQKYPSDSAHPPAGSVTEIWDKLKTWRGYEKGLPELKMLLAGNPDLYKRALEVAAQHVEDFKARILKAVIEPDCAYLENLLKAKKLDRPPELEMHGIRAAIEAFEQLFLDESLKSKDDWPTKQEVRRQAEEILRKAGRALPGERQWPRIFRNAGLWDLPSVTYGHARKRKKN